jgi:hypothetical protein
MRTVPALLGRLAIPALVLAASSRLHAEEKLRPNLLANPGFEGPAEGGVPQGWAKLWTRAKDAGTLALDEQVKHGGARSLKITHTGGQDWSAAQSAWLPVEAGDLFALGGWIKCEGMPDASISVITWDEQKKALDWMHGRAGTSGTHDWKEFTRKFVVPEGCKSIQFRFTGSGPGAAWLDDGSLAKLGNVRALATALEGQEMKLTNAALEVAFAPKECAFTVTDKRSGRVWPQRALNPEIVVRGARQNGPAELQLDLSDFASGLELRATVSLAADQPELTVTLEGQGALPETVAFPQPFVTGKGTWLVVPMNEGILYPVDDPKIPPMWLVTYGGHGLCMPWFGAADLTSGAGVMAIYETPDDARLHILRTPAGGADGGLLAARPLWESSHGQFAYPRKITYVFFEKGGYVAQAKRYREYAKKAGIFKTLARKKDENPNVDLLVGAANIWNWDMDKVALCREMKDAGMERVLWSSGGKPEQLAEINKLGFLSSRYDIYQDVMDPEQFKKLRWIHGDWTTKAWPNDLMIDGHGQWIRGWEVETKDGKMIPCGVLCDQQAPPYARERIAAELKTHPFLCRFIDTTTASPWRECYDPRHAVTRSESRRWKMELLKVVCEEFKLVTGSETGHDAAAPYVHYFEGMLSLGPYRVHDSGRNMLKIVDPPEPQVVEFQLGHKYRAPLWELVYHDCVSAHWYWGDYNNKLPALWAKRDLFNQLYGTPPMYLFDKGRWKEQKERFVTSYRATCPLARKVGYDEMLRHEFLTADHAVQRTAWSSGVEVVVNFGETPHRLPDGQEVKAMGALVFEKK